MANSASSGWKQRKEPETEPDSKVKYDVTNIQIEKVSGNVVEGLLDAGAANWLKRLSVQIRLAETIDGVTWPDEVKKMVIGTRLEGPAATWFVQKFDLIEKMSFKELSDGLRGRFRCRMDRVHIMAELSKTMKRPSESYLDYTHRLRKIAAAMNGGEENNETTEDALSTFTQNAWPQYRPNLLGIVQQHTEHPQGELDKAVEYLSKIAGNDGKRRSPQGRFSAATGKRKDFVETADPGRPSKSTRRDFSSAVCGTCHQRGHTTSYHDRWVARQGGKVATTSAKWAPKQEDDRKYHSATSRQLYDITHARLASVVGSETEEKAPAGAADRDHHEESDLEA